MINVLHVVLGLKIGGLEKFVLDLINQYSDDVQSIIVCLEDKGASGFAVDGIKMIELHKKAGLKLSVAFKIRQIVRKEKIDLIHTHNPSPHFYGALAGMLSWRPVIHTKHGRNYPSQKKKVLLNYISSLLTTHIVAVSKDAKNVCSQVEHIPSRKLMTILNGVDIDKFQPLQSYIIYQELGIASQIPLIGIVARLSPEKDHSTLIQACRLLKERLVLFHLVIVGDGALRADLENEVEQFDLIDEISFMGMRSDICTLVSNFDLFVLSSISEGISLTILEAMACAIPVVATDVGGNSEIVINGDTGFIVPSRTPELLADKIQFLLENPSLRERMGHFGRERVVTSFSMKKTASNYLSLYHEILSDL